MLLPAANMWPYQVRGFLVLSRDDLSSCSKSLLSIHDRTLVHDISHLDIHGSFDCSGPIHGAQNSNLTLVAPSFISNKIPGSDRTHYKQNKNGCQRGEKLQVRHLRFFFFFLLECFVKKILA